MNKKSLFKSRLGLEMLAGMLGALLLCCAVFLGIRSLQYRYIDDAFLNQPDLNDSAFEELQAYVRKNGISSSDLTLLNDWRSTRNNMILILLFSNGRLIYDSSTPEGIVSDDVQINTADYADDYTYTLELADTRIRAAIYDISYTRFYQAADAASYGAAFLLFAVLVVLLIRKKLRYIALLEDELRILEGGDLTCRVTIRGRDELADLARGIDSMRTSILDRERGEAEAQQANRELIAAMSHDLRTPLTSLIGYLTLLLQGRYEDEAQFHHFLSISQEKAQRIKELSDKLFEYFLVYARDTDSILTEEVDAFQFLEQVLDSHVFELTSRGFSVEQDCSGFSAVMRVETGTMLRVFENLFGNIEKYADPSKPVRIRTEASDHAVSVFMENAVSPFRDLRESTRLGLKTCESVIVRHGGSFLTVEEGGCFRVTFSLPLVMCG